MYFYSKNYELAFYSLRVSDISHFSFASTIYEMNDIQNEYTSTYNIHLLTYIYTYNLGRHDTCRITNTLNEYMHTVQNVDCLFNEINFWRHQYYFNYEYNFIIYMKVIMLADRYCTFFII